SLLQLQATAGDGEPQQLAVTPPAVVAQEVEYVARTLTRQPLRLRHRRTTGTGGRRGSCRPGWAGRQPAAGRWSVAGAASLADRGTCAIVARGGPRAGDRGRFSTFLTDPCKVFRSPPILYSWGWGRVSAGGGPVSEVVGRQLRRIPHEYRRFDC